MQPTIEDKEAVLKMAGVLIRKEQVGMCGYLFRAIGINHRTLAATFDYERTLDAALNNIQEGVNHG